MGAISSSPCYSQKTNLTNLITTSQWDSLFPKRAGISNPHPQGYTTDFYSYNNLNQALKELSDFFVVIRTKTGVWGQLITVTKKSTLQKYIYSNVDSWWHTNSTPETIDIVDFEKFLSESSQQDNKRELAAFLANISKETTGGWQLPVGGGSSGDYALWGLYFVHEVGYTSSNSAGTYSQSHAEYPPNPKVGYYGRGPIQLSWNYNYGQFSKFIYNNKQILLDYPDSLKESGVLAFKSAIWFWMMPQCPKPSCHQVMHNQWKNDSSYSSGRMYYKGFAHTNNIINGGLECRTTSSVAFTQKVNLRSDLYKHYLKYLGFNNNQIRKEDSSDYSTLCYVSSSDAMQDYTKCNTYNSIKGSIGYDSIVSCNSYNWIDNIKYTKSTATAYHVIKKGNIKGNDSLVILNLRILPNAKSIFQAKACNSFQWIDGKTYTKSTDSAKFVISGGAFNGCDSVIILRLTILNSSVRNDTVSACHSYTWIDGKTYTKSTDSAMFVISGGAFNGCDSIIILRLTILNSSVRNDTVSSCHSYTWIDGKTYTENTDSAIFIVKGGAFTGCDSVIKLNLEITKVDLTISRNGIVLIANQIADKYQWVECDSNYKALHNDTNKSLRINKNGRYAVIIYNNICIDTSECIEVSDYVSIFKNTNLDFYIFPNPSNNNFYINARIEKPEAYFLFDANGKIILKGFLNNGNNVIYLDGFNHGFYYLKTEKYNFILLKI